MSERSQTTRFVDLEIGVGSSPASGGPETWDFLAELILRSAERGERTVIEKDD